MNASNYKRPIILGAFVITGLVILALAIFTLGSQQKLFSQTFTIRAVFDDVGGLQQGNNVWFSGVKIGTVKKISFYKETQVEIILNIGREAMTHIRKDAKVKISSDGFIGNRIVVIYGGTGSTPTIAAGDCLLTEHSSSTDDILSTLQANNKNLLEITGNFKIISKKITEGKGAVGILLNDPSLANNLKSALANFKTVSRSSEKVMTDVQAFSARLNNGNGLVSELTTDTVVFARLRETIGQLKQASVAVSSFAENMKSAGDSLNGRNNPAGMLLTDDEVAADLKTIISHLRTSSEKLDEDLEALQHNFLLRGFFRKKAKQGKN